MSKNNESDNDLRQLLHNEAIHLAQLAVNFDVNNELEAALYYYKESSNCLQKCLSFGKSPELELKINEYLNRAKVLSDRLINNESQNINIKQIKSEEMSKLLRAEFLMNEALDEDEDNHYENAFELYSQAIQLCLKAKEETNEESIKAKLTSLATKALDRAEAIKRTKTTPKTSETKLDVTQSLDQLKLDETTAQSSSAKSGQLVISGQSSYTKEEIAVLRHTSIINGREYVPFLSIDLKERFSYPIPYCDRDGLLVLSPKQKSNFAEWLRLDELSANPMIITSVDCFTIKQTVVSDCSFVASLAVSALYEKKFGKKIITSIIYPQNRNREPVYNPCGKYMIKFNINGVNRKVLIDDKLPVGRSGELLCSYSSNKNEFWVSLLEKAYMKVMGGYDFPGSNSNIDLHALTSWIPERLSIHGSEADKEKTFKMLYERHIKGDVLITFATGELTDSEGERTGLVPTHAYAMLDIKQVYNKKLFLLKNPWSHMRWKGNFSERDVDNWTTPLKTALHYDPQNAKNFDNGVFWIDIDSLYRFFDVSYLNWNPTIFKYTYCTHDSWNAGVGPVKDLYFIGDNPQYSLTLKSPESTVWILLTRHITDRNDFANNREYIALLVYKNNGDKVYMPFDPPPYIDGVRINSPHYLCKIVPKDGCIKYTLVISQYEKSNTINYTIRAYSTCAFVLKKLVNQYKYKEVEKNGKWSAETAGGCLNNPLTYFKNPIYQLTINGANDCDNELLIDLKGPKDFAVGIDVMTVSVVNQNSPNYFAKTNSGSFRSGFTILQLKNMPAGTYNIIPSTFKPSQIGPFFLTIHSTTPIKLSKMR